MKNTYNLEQYIPLYILDEHHKAIINGEIDTIKNKLEDDWNINEEIGYAFKFTPIIIAILSENYLMIDFLLENNAKLDYRGCHAIFYAVLCEDIKILEYVINKGAKVNVKNEVGYNIFDVIYSDNKFESIKNKFEIIDNNGFKIKDNCELVLKYAVGGDDFKMVNYLLSQGININSNKIEGSYSEKISALHIAARNGNLNMVKLLVENGANVVTESGTGRPYQYAMLNRHYEVANYLKTLEPEEYHDENRANELADKYELTNDLIKYLKGDNRRLVRKDYINSDYLQGENIEYIELLPYIDLYEYKIKRTTYLQLTFEMNNYDINILWSKKRRSWFIIMLSQRYMENCVLFLSL